MKDDNKVFNRNILIAVDDSDNARRAVSYVAQLLGSVKGFKVSLLHVIPQPEEDFFPTSAEKRSGSGNTRQGLTPCWRAMVKY